MSCRGSCQRWQWSARQRWSGGDYPATLFRAGSRLGPVSPFSGQLLGSLTLDTASRGARSLALMNLFAQLFSLISTICFAHLFGLFPDGRIYRRFERHILRAAWWLLLVPAFLLVATPVVPLPDYFPTAPIVNPFHLLNIDLDGDRAYGLNQLTLSVLIVVGVVMLVLRYRRFGSTQRRQIRWLLLPAFIAAFAVPAYLLFDWPNWFFSVLYIGTTLSMAVSLASRLLEPSDCGRRPRPAPVSGVRGIVVGDHCGVRGSGCRPGAGGWAALDDRLGDHVDCGGDAGPAAGTRLARAHRRSVGVRGQDRSDRVIARLGATLEDTTSWSPYCH